jgi:hypothetical protein
MMATLAKGANRGDSGHVEARVAVLEQIAADTKETLKDIKDHLLRLEDSHKAYFRGLEDDFRRVEEHQRSDFRLLLSAGAAATIGLAALMAHGFHWF